MPSPATSASAKILSPTSSNGIGQTLSVGFRPLPDSTPSRAPSSFLAGKRETIVRKYYNVPAASAALEQLVGHCGPTNNVMKIFEAPETAYRSDRSINVTTQSELESGGWRVVVDMPPRVSPHDRAKVALWLNEYKKTIKTQFPDMHVSVYCDETQFVLEATPASPDHRDLAETRWRRMLDVLGDYGERKSNTSF